MSLSRLVFLFLLIFIKSELYSINNEEAQEQLLNSIRSSDAKSVKRLISDFSDLNFFFDKTQTTPVYEALNKFYRVNNSISLKEILAKSVGILGLGAFTALSYTGGYFAIKHSTLSTKELEKIVNMDTKDRSSVKAFFKSFERELAILGADWDSVSGKIKRFPKSEIMSPIFLSIFLSAPLYLLIDSIKHDWLNFRNSKLIVEMIISSKNFKIDSKSKKFIEDNLKNYSFLKNL